MSGRLASWGLPAALGGTAGLLASLAPDGLAGAFAVLGVLVVPTAIVLSGREPRDESRKLLVLFLAAVAVRTAVALLVTYLAPSHFFAADDHKYARLGLELAAHWAGEGPYPALLYGRPGYYVWNALIFTLLGYAPSAPAFANAALGGFGCLLAHAIARDLAGPRAGLLAAGLAAFWPSLVLWSSLNLKDAWVILALLLLLRGAQRLGSRVTGVALLQLAFGFAVVSLLRGYLALVALAAVALALLLPRLRTSPVVALALLALAAVVVPSVAPVQELAAEASFESIDQMRSRLALGESAYLTDADVSTPGAALRFLPAGLVYFLFAPLPWQLFNARQLLTLPEMLAWYALVPLVVIGLRDALQRRFAAAAPLAFFAGLATLSYALVEGNLGTAYRHRAQVMILFLIFAAVGFVARRGVSARAGDAEAPAAVRPGDPLEVPV